MRLTVGKLKKALENIDDSLEVFIATVFNLCGNVAEADRITQTQYGFFGVGIPCIKIDSVQYPSNRKEDKNEIVLYEEKREEE